MFAENPFLLPAAFEAVPMDHELESKLSSLYGAGVERISDYSEDRSSVFWTQMETLERLYLSMATGDILCSEPDRLFHKLRNNFYTPTPDIDYSALYQSIKSTLETILILMREKSETDQQKIIQKINAASGVCGPGLFTNLQEIAASLRKMEGLCFWLAESRRVLLDLLAERYITAYKISGGMSVHVHFAFNKIANEAGLNIPSSEAYAGVPDGFERLLPEPYEEMKKKFLTAFKIEYSRAYILETLIARFQEVLRSFKERMELAVAEKPYKSFIKNLSPFTEIVPPVFDLGNDILEANDDYTVFTIKPGFFEKLPGYCETLTIRQGILADLNTEGFEKIPASRLDGIDIFGIPLDKINWTATATEPQPSFFASMEQILALSLMEGISLDFSRIHLSDREIPHPKLDGEQVKRLYSKGFRKFRGCNLSSADLTGADLSIADLRGADLTGTNLTSANLIDADLRLANLTGATLTRDHLSGIKIQGTKLDRSTFEALYDAGIKDFSFCDLSSADLTGANLSGANLINADLRGTNLSGAKLINADLRGTNLSGANLSNPIIWSARLDRATFDALHKAGIRNFSFCNLSEANLTGADLTGADLTGTNLSHVIIRGARLDHSAFDALYQAGIRDFRKCDLTGADLTGADLSGIQIYGAKLDRSTFMALYAAGIKDFRLCDLVGANLSGEDLRAANLTGVIIKGAQLDRSAFDALYQAGIRNFSGCNLTGADLTGANLTDANLTSANLTGVIIKGAQLDRATFDALYRAGIRDFSFCNLSCANFKGEDLRGANLSGANLLGADLSGVDLSSTDLTGTNLKSTDLRGAKLFGAKLSDVMITGARLDRATFDALHNAGIRNFSFCNLSGADLSGVNLTGAHLSDIQIKSAKLDRSTFMALYAAGIKDFHYCDLSLAHLTAADLTGAHLSGIQIQGAKLDCSTFMALYAAGIRDFRFCDLSLAHLTDADLTGAHLSGILIQGTRLDRSAFDALYQAGIRDFRRCNLSDTDLSGADLRVANLAGTTLKNTNVHSAIIDCYLFKILYAAKENSTNFDKAIFYVPVAEIIPFLNDLSDDLSKKSDMTLSAIQMIINQPSTSETKSELLAQLKRWIDSDECFLDKKRRGEEDSDPYKALHMIDEALSATEEEKSAAAPGL